MASQMTQQPYQQNAYDYSYTPDTNYGTTTSDPQQQLQSGVPPQEIQTTPQQNQNLPQQSQSENLNTPSQLNYNIPSNYSYQYPYQYQYQYDPNYAYSYQNNLQNLQYQQQHLNQNVNNIVKESVTGLTSNENLITSSSSGAKIQVELENKNNP